MEKSRVLKKKVSSSKGKKMLGGSEKASDPLALHLLCLFKDLRTVEE